MLCSHKAEYTKADPPSLHVCLLGKSCSLASADMFSEEKKNQRLLLRKPRALFFFYPVSSCFVPTSSVDMNSLHMSY